MFVSCHKVYKISTKLNDYFIMYFVLIKFQMYMKVLNEVPNANLPMHAWKCTKIAVIVICFEVYKLCISVPADKFKWFVHCELFCQCLDWHVYISYSNHENASVAPWLTRIQIGLFSLHLTSAWALQLFWTYLAFSGCLGQAAAQAVWTDH